MFISSLWFGILLLLRAVLAQSAPNRIYTSEIDEDEEALVDKLATLVAMGRPIERIGTGGPSRRYPTGPVVPQFLDDEREDLDFDKPMYLDLDIPSPDDYVNGPSGAASEGPQQQPQPPLNIGPKQFAYKPSDIRFYVPPEDFPYVNANSADTNVQQRQDIFNAELAVRDKPAGAADILKPEPSQNSQASAANDESTRNQAPPHMKKSQDELYEDQEGVFSDEPAAQPGNVMSSVHGADKPAGPYVSSFVNGQNSFSIYYVAMIAALSSAAVVGLVGAGICWYRIHERVKAAAEVDYPAYGVTGPSKDVSPTGGDRKLAQSAHLYHYKYQKEQMAALQKSAMEGSGAIGGGGDKQGSDIESDDDNEEGDYTVYECPGLAPAGDMEVKNPLFQDEPTPATPSQMPTEVTDENRE